MIYLMCPYYSPLPTLREARATLASIVAGELMQQFPGDWVFSPITQGHAVAPWLPSAKLKDHDFWLNWCKGAFRDATRVMLLPLPGWKQSNGIAEELSWIAEYGCEAVQLIDALEYFSGDWLRQLNLSDPLHYRLRTVVQEYEAMQKWLHDTQPWRSQMFQRYSLARKTLIVNQETDRSDDADN